MKNNRERIFSDLSRLTCNDFQFASGTGTGWICVEYELDEFSGKGLATGACSRTEEIVLDLKLEGWHKLYIAFNPEIRVWLDGDNGYYQMEASPHDIRDYFCFEADFTGKKLHIAPVRSSVRNKELTVFYIRAVQSERKNSKKNLIATNDGHCLFWDGIDSIRDLYRYLLPLKNTDFFRMVWGLYGGGLLSTGDSKVADKIPWSDENCFYERQWVFNRSLKGILEKGDDPLVAVRDITEEIGLELHFYFRVGAFYWPFPLHGRTSSFYLSHPEWHCVDEYGNRVKRISYAFRQVQDVICEYFQEIIDRYDPDGLCLAFNRGLPLMICEKPVIEEFERVYGRKPVLPEQVDSPEMLKIRHKLLAEFVERVYRMTSSKGKALSCIVPRDFDRNLLFGLDIEMLVKKGFFESVLVGAGHKDQPQLNLNLEPVLRLKRCGTKIYPGGSGVNAHGGAWKPEDLLARATFMAKILDMGFDGAYFWDVDQIVDSTTEWEILGNFGTVDILNGIIEGRLPTIKYHETKRIYDLRVDRYNPWNAY